MSSFVDGTYVNKAGARNYKLYVGRPFWRAAPPLFVMLHGCDQDAADFALGTRMNELADESGGVVLYPEQSRYVNLLGCWSWHSPMHQRARGGEPSLIAGMTRQVIAAQGIDRSRVYVAGMSAGGAMALILGQQYPSLYAAVGVHSGVPSGMASNLMAALNIMQHGPGPAVLSVPPTRGPAGRRVPTIVFHGDEDRTVHPANAHAVHTQASGSRPAPCASGSSTSIHIDPNDSRNADERRTRTFTRCLDTHDGVSDRELWIIHGAGHAWAGGSPEGTYTDAMGPDASREMVRFFLQRRLDRKRTTRIARSRASAEDAGPVLM